MEENDTKEALLSSPLSKIDFNNPQETLEYEDSRGFNYLMIAAESGKNEILEQLLKLKFDVNRTVGEHSAASLAYENHHVDTLLLLFKANAKFPPNFNVREISQEELMGLNKAAKEYTNLTRAQNDAENATENESFIKKDEVYRPTVSPKLSRKRTRFNQKSKRKIFVWENCIVILIIFIILMICGAVYLITRTPYYSWKTMSDRQRQRVLNGNVEFAGVTVKFRELFNESHTNIMSSLSSPQIRKFINGGTLKLSEPRNKHLEDQIFLQYSNSSDRLRRKIEGGLVTFQGKDMLMRQIVGNNSQQVLEFLTRDEILTLLRNETAIEVGTGVKLDENFYIERKFYLRDIELDFLSSESTARHQKSLDDLLANSGSEIEQNNDIADDYFVYSDEDDKHARNVSNVLIADFSGNGKTTVLKQLAAKMKAEQPTNWVAFISTKDHVDAFKRDENFKKFDNEEVLEVLSEMLLESDSRFEQELLRKFFDTGNVVLLWDDIDEAAGCCRHFILNFLKAVSKKAKLLQVISSQPYFGRSIEKALNISGYKFYPYTESDRKDFLRKFFESKKLSDNQVTAAQKNFNVLSEKIQNFDSSINAFINNPKVTRAIAEISIPDQPIPLDVTNFYSIYDHLVTAKLGSYGVVKEDVLQAHQQHALLNTFQDDLTSPDNTERSPSELPLHIIGRNLTKYSDEASSHEIMAIKSNGMAEFAYESLQQFFVAQFLVQSICEHQPPLDPKEVESRVRLLIKALSHDSKVPEFLRDYFKLNDSRCFDDDSQFRDVLQTTVKKKLKTFISGDNFERRLEQVSIFSHFFPLSLRELWAIDGNETFVTWLANAHPRNFIASYDRIVDVSKSHFPDTNDINTLFRGKFQEGNFLFTAAHFERKSHKAEHLDFSAEDFLNLTSFDAKAFDFEKLSNCKEFREFFEFVKEIRESEFADISRELFRRSIGRIMKYFVSGDRIKRYHKIWKQIEETFSAPNEIEEFLLLDDSLLDSVLTTSIFSDAIISAVIDTYKLHLPTNSTMFYGKLFYETDEGDAYFLKANLQPLMKSKENFENFWSLVKIHTSGDQQNQLLLSMNVKGGDDVFLNILYGALKTAKSSTFESVLSVYREVFEDRMMRYLCLNFFGTVDDDANEVEKIDLQAYLKFIEYCKGLFKKDETKEFLSVITDFKSKLENHFDKGKYSMYARPLDKLIVAFKPITV